MGLDEHGYSSPVVERIVTAAARFSSFRDAADAVRMTGVSISDNQVRRLAHEVGRELSAAHDRNVVEHRRRRLEPRTEVIPVAVVVEVDGGRLRPRTAGAGAGVHEVQNKEDKVACLATLSGPTFATDPCPEPPDAFRCPRRMRRLVAQMKSSAGEPPALERENRSACPVAPSGEPEGTARWSPGRLVRTCVTSLGTSASFGPMMAAEARERCFYEAPRRAFVADGSAYNGTIWPGYFGTFEPITDFLHALCYVFPSAHAVSPDGSRAGPGTWPGCGRAGRAGSPMCSPSWTTGRRAWVSPRRVRRRQPTSAGTRAGWWPRRGATWGTIGTAWTTRGTAGTGYRRRAVWSSPWWAR